MKVSLKFSLVVILLQSVVALEEAEPEVYLRPRNYNPHPYEIAYRQSQQPIYENQVESYARQNTGPVLFPSNPSENIPTNQYVVAVRPDHPVHRHPYPILSKKKKYGLGYFKNEEQVNPQVYKALAIHGAKVLKTPQAKDLKDVKFDPTFSNQKKNYAFSYKVVDSLTGDDFSHSQTQNSQATNGEYRVKLPDGRVQIVSYTADSNGYKADVKYAEDDDQPPPPYGNAAVGGNYVQQVIAAVTPAPPQPPRYVHLHHYSAAPVPPGAQHETDYVSSTLSPYPGAAQQHRHQVLLQQATPDLPYGHVYVDAIAPQRYRK